MIVGAGEASAQGVDTAGVAAKLGPVTRVLAIGNLTPKATPAALPAVLAREVPATLELYLAGKIDGWYARPDQTGVVFILNVTTVEAAKALLDPLPLGQAGMMTFELTPIGPLQPLGRLLPLATK
ncbi:hypothetical protein JEY30_29680 [Bradyrhizobium japonicum]|nr:hypothetical protein JEY30_29680 [Bradyrhizobium japonicum]